MLAIDLSKLLLASIVAGHFILTNRLINFHANQPVSLRNEYALADAPV